MEEGKPGGGREGEKSWNKVFPPDVSVFAFRPVLLKQWGHVRGCVLFSFLIFLPYKNKVLRTSTTIDGSGTLIVRVCAGSSY